MTDELISKNSEAASKSWDWDGWERVVESNGYYREWDNDRYVECPMTVEKVDSQNDKMHLSAFLLEKTTDDTMTRIEWICKNGVISLVHGQTELGFVHVGKPLAYKHDGNKIDVRWGAYGGSEMMDFLWKDYISKDDDAGLSIGGQNLLKDCKNGVCDVTKTDVWEIAWTPSPANDEAINSFINKMAKSKDKVFLPERPDVEKECGKKRRRKSRVIKAILDYVTKNEIQDNINALDIMGKCNHCDEFVKYLIETDGQNITKSINSLQSILDYIVRKGNVCICQECGYSSLMQSCGYTSCPMCGADMHTMVRPAFKSDTMEKAKVSLAPGQKPPKGARVMTGPRGGKYYESGAGKAPEAEKPRKRPSGFKDVISEENEDKASELLSEVVIAISQDKPKQAESKFRRAHKLVFNRDIPDKLDDKYMAIRNKLRDEYPDIDLNKSETEGQDMPEDEEKKEPEKEEDAPSTPGEDENEEEYEEMDNKTLTKTVMDIQKSVAANADGLKSNAQLIKDLSSKLMKADAGTGEDDDNQIDEEKEKPSGEPNPPGDISAKSKDLSLKDAVDVVLKSGYTIAGVDSGAPEIKPMPDKAEPAGVRTEKDKGSKVLNTMTQLLKVKGGL